MVRDFSIQYKILDNLNIYLLIEKAKFCLKSDNYDVYSLIDRDGETLELKKDCNLPVVNISDKIPNVGEKVSDSILSSLNLINQIFISYNIKEGKIIEGNL